MEKHIDEKVSRELSESVTEQIVSQIRTRAPKGEKYWYIDKYGEIKFAIEIEHIVDVRRFVNGNYFSDKKEAKRIANKLRAVLKGAEVIEMPSEEEYKKRLDYFESYSRFGAKEIWNWLQSKIVK